MVEKHMYVQCRVRPRLSFARPGYFIVRSVPGSNFETVGISATGTSVFYTRCPKKHTATQHAAEAFAPHATHDTHAEYPSLRGPTSHFSMSQRSMKCIDAVAESAAGTPAALKEL